MTRPLPAPPPWFDDLHESGGHREEPTFYIDRDIPPPSKAKMARRLVRDRALQRWHTDRSIGMDFEAWWKWLARGSAA